MAVVRAVVLWVLRWGARLLPKDGSVVVACVPSYDDTLRTLLPALAERGIAPIVLVDDTSARPPWLDPEVRLLALGSPVSFWRFVRASAIVTTHGLYGCPPPGRNQLVVNLWHGMTIKRIDRAIGGVPWPFSFTIATSEAFADILAPSFEVPRADVVVTGLPRNDVLAAPESPDPAIVRSTLGIGDYLVSLPTYRSASSSPVANSGSDASLALEPDQREALAECLERLDLHLLVKPHPDSPAELLASWAGPRVHAIDDAWLVEHGVTLYGVLQGAHSLVTDYSSVAVDFVATGRHAVFYQPDLEAYLADRGMAMPREDYRSLGPATTSFDEFLYLLAAGRASGFASEGPPDPAMWSTPADGASTRVVDEILRRWPEGPEPR